jgi:hypothetical protein
MILPFWRFTKHHTPSLFKFRKRSSQLSFIFLDTTAGDLHTNPSISITPRTQSAPLIGESLLASILQNYYCSVILQITIMDIKDNVKLVCSRVQTILRKHRRKEKRTIEIVRPKPPSTLR